MATPTFTKAGAKATTAAKLDAKVFEGRVEPGAAFRADLREIRRRLEDMAARYRGSHRVVLNRSVAQGGVLGHVYDALARPHGIIRRTA